MLQINTKFQSKNFYTYVFIASYFVLLTHPVVRSSYDIDKMNRGRVSCTYIVDLCLPKAVSPSTAEKHMYTLLYLYNFTVE